MTQTVYRQIKEFDNGIYTSIVDTNSYTLFTNDIEKGLDYFEKAGGTFLSNEVTGERFYGEIQLDDILYMLQCLMEGEFEYDDEIYDDFMYMRRCCLEDEKNDKRYCDEFFNIYIL